MAEYVRAYFVGAAGAAGGIERIDFQIMATNSRPSELHVHYLDRSIYQLGGVRTVIPAARGAASSLLDACVAFYPQHFRHCPSLRQIARELRSVQVLDFGGENVPAAWPQLRREAETAFARLSIRSAPLCSPAETAPGGAPLEALHDALAWTSEYLSTESCLPSPAE